MSTNWQLKGDNHIHLGSPSSKITQGIRNRLETVYSKVDFNNKNILDCGAGLGTIMKDFMKHSDKVTGSEIDAEKVAIGKKEGLNIIQVQDEHLPLPENTFDIVFSHEVIEHTNDDNLIISEMNRVLKPGGKLVLFCPNKWFPFETHGIYIGKKYYFGNKLFFSWMPEFLRRYFCPHVKIYSKRSLEKLLLQNNFAIIEHTVIAPGFGRVKNMNIPIIKPLIMTFFNSKFFQEFGISRFVIAEKLERKS